jgi:hypothetical protein
LYLLTFHSFYSEKIFSIEASSSYRHVGDTTGMGTTDQRLKAAHKRGTDDTDEEQRQISGGAFIPPLGRIQSNLPFLIRFFISGIGVIRGRSLLRFGCS